MVKRYMALALMLAVSAGGAWAQITFGGGVDLVLVPAQVVGRDTAEHEGNLWLGTGAGVGATEAGMRARLAASGNFEDRFGFNADFFFMALDGETGVGDQASLWMRPADWFRLDVGMVSNGSQAGQIGGHWLSAWSVGMFGGGNIFSAHSTGGVGVLGTFNIPQVEGLSLYVFVPSFGMSFSFDDRDFAWLPDGLLTPGGGAGNDPELGNMNRHRALRVFERTWVTAGYEFSSQVRGRVQFIGANPSGSVSGVTTTDNLDPYRFRVSMNAPRFEAAVSYRFPNRFLIDVGARAWLPISNWVTDTWINDPDGGGYVRGGTPGTFWGGIGFGLGLSANITDEFRLNFRVDGDMLRTWTGPHMGVESVTNPMRLSAHLWPQYTLGNGMVLTLHAGVNYVGRNVVEMVDGSNPNADSIYWDRSDRLRFGGGIGIGIPLFAGSNMNIGLTYRHGTADIRGGEPRVISVPITFWYNF